MIRTFGWAAVLAFAILAFTVLGMDEPPVAYAPASAGQDTTLTAYRDSIPGTLVSFEMIPVPGGTVAVETDSGTQVVEVAPFWIGQTEVTWNEYDIFAYRLDLPPERRTEHEDAVSRPSRPYAPPDYGFGHDGFAAICITYRAAEQYAAWLSEKTGKNYRLPTEAEWQLAGQAGAEQPTPYTADQLTDMAWFSANSPDQTQAVASKAPNALGLYDMLGNVAEWVVGLDGKPVTAGGSFRDEADGVQTTTRASQERSWNKTDPQIPKSKWWLSDGFFVGFRLLREP